MSDAILDACLKQDPHSKVACGRERGREAGRGVRERGWEGVREGERVGGREGEKKGGCKECMRGRRFK